MLVKASYIVDDVTHINLSELWETGVRGFIFDLDNTIMKPKTWEVPENVMSWLGIVHETGFKTIVVSNNPIVMYTSHAQERLQIPVLGNAGKPRRKSLRKALEMIELTPAEVAIVGDRPLTDIWGGQRLGMVTILVHPLNRQVEHPVIQYLRGLERLFVKNR